MQLAFLGKQHELMGVCVLAPSLACACVPDHSLQLYFHNFYSVETCSQCISVKVTNLLIHCVVFYADLTKLAVYHLPCMIVKGINWQ